jgi:hypothetical protein
MPGPGWYLIDDAEESEVLDALAKRNLSRYRFDDETELSKTMLFEREMSSGSAADTHSPLYGSCSS